MSTIDPMAKDFLAQKRIAVAGDALRLCWENNITAIHGGCPMMFCEPVDLGTSACGVYTG